MHTKVAQATEEEDFMRKWRSAPNNQQVIMDLVKKKMEPEPKEAGVLNDSNLHSSLSYNSKNKMAKN
jgi:hypothetical protein